MAGDKDERMDRVEERLKRIEEKLDRIVRLEERQVGYDESLKRAFGRVETLESRVRELEIQHGRSDTKTDNTGRLVWAVVSVALGVLGSIIGFSLRS